MPISNGMNLARLLGSTTNIRSRYVAPVESGSSVSTLADMDALIAKTGMTTGDQAYVQSNNNLYLYNGSGWYLVATVENAQPTAISGVESAYALASDGSPTVITATATDPEGFPLTWSYAITTGSLGSTATVSQTDNVFTITPSTDEADYGEFSITFSVTDGATGVVSTVSAFTLSFSWTVDLSNVTDDGVSFDLSSQDGRPYSIAFNTNGTKMYTTGYDNSKVYQYSLSTAFNLSTASYDNVSFSVASQDTAPTDIAFNSDGTKMYMTGEINNTVYQYTLSTAFDLSTASYDSVSFSVASQEATPLAGAFNTSGTKMYIVGHTNRTIYQYSLSTAFDLSTASYDSVSFSVVSQDNVPADIAFDTSGTKMYITGYGNKTVYQYSLSTAFDLSTASYDSVSFSVASKEIYPVDTAFSSDGTKMYVVGTDNDTIYQYSTGL